MKKTARLGDIHKGICSHGEICCPHYVVGPITTASTDVITNGRGQARDRDLVTHDCPHCGTGYIVASSGSVNVNKRRIARVGDLVVYPGGQGKIIEHAKDVNAG